MRTPSTTADGAPAAVKSAYRVLDIFELLVEGRTMSHTDISEALRIPKSSLTQLLRTLVARGYLGITPDGRGYQFGSRLLELASGVGLARDLVQLADQILQALTRDTGESSALNLIKGEMAEVKATVLGPARLVTHMRLGDLAPLYATSGGKAILAHMPKEFQQRYLATVQFVPATPRTLTTAAELKRQLAAIRSEAFAYSHEEWTPGIVGIATPFLGLDGAVLGSLNVAIPAARYDEVRRANCEEALRRAVDGLRHLLTPPR